MDYIPVNKKDNPNDIRESHNEKCIAQMSAEEIDKALYGYEVKYKMNTQMIFQKTFKKNL